MFTGIIEETGIVKHVQPTANAIELTVQARTCGRGLKVGELKVSGPQLDVNIDADIIAGECQPGDEVREE